MGMNLAGELTRRGWELTVVTMSNGAGWPQNMPPAVKWLNLGKTGQLDIPHMILRLARVIRFTQPALIHTRVYFTAVVTHLARRLAGGDYAQVSAIDCTLSQYLQNESLPRMRRLACRSILPRLDHIVAVSTGVKKDLVQNFQVESARCSVIWNSVETENVRRAADQDIPEDNAVDDSPLIVTAGRLVREKNFELLLRSFARVRANRAVRHHILGAGPEKSKLEKMASELGVESSVNFKGYVTNPFKYFRAADVFVMSSESEGFGNVVVEAMACGTAVVSTRYQHGADEIITDGLNGLLVPCGDSERMAVAIQSLLDDDRKRRRIAEAGQRRAEDFDNKKIAAQYSTLFERVIRQYV